jgi:hypothetical protein
MKLKPDQSLRHVEAGSGECQRLCRKPDRPLKAAIDMDRAIRSAAWAEARHVKSVKRIEREAEEGRREWRKAARWFRVRASVRWGESGKAVRHSTSSHRAIRVSSLGGALPSYSFAIRDRQHRLFVFQRIRYASASNTRQGHARYLASYGIAGACLLESGDVAFASNVGSTPEEVGEAFNQLELVNRSSAKNAKVAFHAIYAVGA